MWEDDEDAAREAPAKKFAVGWATAILLWFTSVKVAGAVLMVLRHSASPHLAGGTVPVVFVIIQLLSFGGTGIWLLIANAGDSRTTYLGAVLLLIASAFTTGHFADLAQPSRIGGWLIPLYPDSFLGYYLARFVAEFPPRDRQSPSARLIRSLGVLALWAGWTLFMVNAIVGWHLLPGLSKWTSPLLRRSAGGTIYWTLVFVVVLLLLFVALLTGTQPLPPEERRRVRVFWGAFGMGFAPLVAIVVLGVVPHVGPAATQWALTGVPLFYVHTSLASIPLTVSYAVLVRRILPVRVVVRQAVRYLLARSVVTAGFLIPLVLLILHSYTHRNLTIAQAFSGHFRTLAAIGGLAGLALLCREDILRFLDRRFFREEYDAREVLVRLTGESRRVHRIEELVALVTAGIDRALRPEPVAILVRDRSRSQFVSPFGSVEPLPCSSVLADILNVSNEPLDVSLQPAQGLAWLPRAERQWLVDSRSRLLLALRASDGGLLGLVTLGERKSELPFSREDRRLLTAIAESAALTIEHHAVRSESAEEDDWWRVGAAPHGSAMECEGCGRVQARVASCVECGGVLLEAQVPRLMFGKFQFERRVGRGAMGIVYEVRDLSLDRTVAIKTLPGTSPEHAERLRLEAKAMAAVTHPNLATIHGAESWRGRPMLVCEFMAHGTLADRLVHNVLTVNETLALGIALADALRVIHGAGLLHRDIKPSNIGFAHDSSPKLLDFGLVRMLAAGGVRSQAVSDRETSDPLASLTVTNSLIGTPLYLAPEAIAGSAPSVSFDLWSLNVLLLEAATGHHPFRAQGVEETLRRVCECGVTELLDEMSGRCRPLAMYLERALAKDPNLRLRSAVQVAEALREIARTV